MKVLIVSDTHGRTETLEQVLLIENPDLMIHLGDVEGDEDYIEAIAKCTCVFIAGNNDWFSRLPYTKAMKLGNLAIHMEHGHRLRGDKAQILRDAKDLGIDVFMFGHTHMPVLEKHDNIWIVNPGSLERPRQSSRRKTYIIMEVPESGEAQFELREY